MEVKIINTSRHALPEYETRASAGMDIRAHLDQEVVLAPLERRIIPTGLFIELPMGIEARYVLEAALPPKRESPC